MVLLVAAPMARAQDNVPPDWARAVELMRAKRAQAALPYLEKLVRQYPENAVFRLELGYALYQLKNDGRARYHIERARGGKLTGPERNAADGILNQIARRKVWSVRLGFSIEPATNAGKGTVASTIAIDGLVLTIPDTLRTQQATGAILSAGFSVRPRFNETLSANLSLDGVVRYYENQRLRETLVLGRAGLRRDIRANTWVEGGLVAGKEYAAGSPYSHRYGVYAAAHTPLGRRTFARVGFEHYRVAHDSFTLADGPRTLLSGNLSFALNPQTVLRAKAFVLHTDAAAPLQAGVKGALSLGASYAFKGGLVAGLDITAGIDRRDGFSIIAGARREDRSLSIEAEFYNSTLKVGRFLPVIKVKHERNRSNIALNSYSNTAITLGIRTTY